MHCWASSLGTKTRCEEGFCAVSGSRAKPPWHILSRKLHTRCSSERTAGPRLRKRRRRPHFAPAHARRRAARIAGRCESNHQSHQKPRAPFSLKLGIVVVGSKVGSEGRTESQGN